MKTKMKLAHEFAMKLVGNPTTPLKDMNSIIAASWSYADAMQAEADKRKDKTRPSALLTKDKDGKCLHLHHEFGHKKCMDCGASLKKFHPDWNEAPEWANYWIKTSGDLFAWLERKPRISNLIGGWNIECIKKQIAQSFNYQGNWQDSLRKRPQ